MSCCACGQASSTAVTHAGAAHASRNRLEYISAGRNTSRPSRSRTRSRGPSVPPEPSLARSCGREKPLRSQPVSPRHGRPPGSLSAGLSVNHFSLISPPAASSSERLKATCTATQGEEGEKGLEAWDCTHVLKGWSRLPGRSEYRRS